VDKTRIEAPRSRLVFGRVLPTVPEVERQREPRQREADRSSREAMFHFAVSVPEPALREAPGFAR
jgi:hypothetical protein